MSKYEKFVTWLDTYREVAFDLLRIYLGIGLFVRGALFILFPSTYTAVLGPSPGWLATSVLYYGVAFVHLVGGAMMAAGLLTRLAALFQIPILLGAVFLVHFQGGLVTA
ncbi:MAG: DoxX family protein, partial [Rhodothermales bacterium]|nr:DoxX family protein [Rhodothermales bacterium]